MQRLTLEEVFDIPYPAIIAILRDIRIQIRDNKINILQIIKYFSNYYLLTDNDRRIIESPIFSQIFGLTNNELIQKMYDQGKEVSIFTTKSEMLRNIITFNDLLGELKLCGSMVFLLSDEDSDEDSYEEYDLNKILKSIPSNKKVKYVSVGEGHVALITEDEQLFTLGDNEYGQLGNGKSGEYEMSSELNLIEMKNNEKVEIVSCGRACTAVITKTGKLMTFGYNHTGELGLGLEMEESVPTPTEVRINEKVKMVSCGGRHTAIITESGKLMTFGENTFGQLGLGNFSWADIRYLPALVNLGEKKAKIVSCGYIHTAIITEAGELMTFGYNQNGELGLGIFGEPQSIPTLVNMGNEKAIMVSCGGGNSAIIATHEGNGGHTAVVTQNGDVMTFGADRSGQLGTGSYINRSRPRLVDLGGEKVKMVSCGEAHTALITKNGKLLAFGHNGADELCLRDKSSRAYPIIVGAIDQPIMIDCGWRNTAVITKL